MSTAARRSTHALRLCGVLATALCSACGAPSSEPDEPAPAEPRAGPVGSSIEAACWAVAVLEPDCSDPGECPDSWTCPQELADGWGLHGDRMFADGSQALADLGMTAADLPALLARFCLYRADATAAMPGETDLPASIDCPAAVPQASTLTPPLQKPLREVFDAHAGASDLVAGEADVTVAVVDTHSDRSSDPPTVDHAVAVRRVIERLACPAGSECAVHQTHALALPLEADGSLADPDDGIYGTRAHLAIGVMEAVTEWRMRMEETSAFSPLVVNLSVGWTASDGAACTPNERAPWCDEHVVELASRVENPTWHPALPSLYAVEALHAALVYASCSGAVVIAAAGNAEDDSCNAEMVAPAAWGQYSAPTLTECLALGFDPPAGVAERLPSSAAEAWPLVTAVSAVRPDDQPIAATRPGSLTPLVAPGYHVTADPAQTPLSGTSMSAAVVSGVAALVWSQEPAMLPGELLAHLHATGAPVGLVSELPLHGMPAGTAVRRVSACAAQPSGSSCDPADQSDLEARLEALNASALVEATAATRATFSATATGLVEDACSSCGLPTAAWVPTEPMKTEHWFFEACAETPTTFVFDAGSEVAGPQPDVPICPDCPVLVSAKKNSARAFLAIDTRYLAPSTGWRGANLVMLHASGTRTVIDLSAIVPLSVLSSGDVIEVVLEGSWIDVRRVTMNAVLESDGTVYTRGNELLLRYD